MLYFKHASLFEHAFKMAVVVTNHIHEHSIAFVKFCTPEQHTLYNRIGFNWEGIVKVHNYIIYRKATGLILLDLSVGVHFIITLYDSHSHVPLFRFLTQFTLVPNYCLVVWLPDLSTTYTVPTWIFPVLFSICNISLTGVATNRNNLFINHLHSEGIPAYMSHSLTYA